MNNLDLAAAKAYLLLFSFRNAYGSAEQVRLYFNDVTTGYNTQQLYSSAGSTVSGAITGSRYTYAYASQKVINEGLIMRTPDGYSLIMSRNFLYTGSAPTIFFFNVFWNNTANPTKIELQGAMPNMIAAGSRLIIFKVKT